jgi:peptidoglycan/LPS O-acetylase OafA/YrhL
LRRLTAWFCLVGGLLWGLKPLYDWLVLNRTINTGYTASDVTDYIKFIFPLLCLGGIFVLYSLYKNKIRKSIILLTLAILLNSLFHFTEMYFYGTDIPFGLLFLLTGLVFQLIGALTLTVQLKGIESHPRSLYRLAACLFVTTLLICLLPFVSGSFPEVILTTIMVVLMMLIGFTWAVIGGVLISMANKITTEIPKGFGA